MWELSLLGDGGVSRPYPGSAGRCFAGALRLPRTTFVPLAYRVCCVSHPPAARGAALRVISHNERGSGFVGAEFTRRWRR
ncbi:hypothetical protein, partial [Halomonas citrativorans]|uniref:hypothetical protein n=1 Tax=Halomonas citrativorans TaxID=2742612 RepID=UPI001CE4ABBF